MGDLDDMNATPLGKLPLPAVQMKGDGPKVDMGTSYADILKQMNAPKGETGAQQFQQQQQFSPAAASTAHQYQQQFLPPVQYQNYEGAHHQQERQQRMVAAAPRRPRAAPPPPPAKRRSRDDAAGPGWLAKARLYKSSILVAAVVLVVLMYVSPKLAQLVPRLLTPMGKFNFMGLLIVAVLCGGIHRVADVYVRA